MDFKAVDFIHNAIVDARNRGVAVLLLSEDLDELLALADRIIVISEGQFVYESPIEKADFEGDRAQDGRTLGEGARERESKRGVRGEG